jgi:hypothetical protein
VRFCHPLCVSPLLTKTIKTSGQQKPNAPSAAYSEAKSVKIVRRIHGFFKRGFGLGYQRIGATNRLARGAML